MADAIRLKVYTPVGVILEDTVQSVTLQNSEGEIGILPGHARYISLLGTGILTYVKSGGETRKLIASEGFCHFIDGELVVLADHVDLPSQVGKIDVGKEKEVLNKELQQANFFEPKWDIKVSQLKRLEAIEKLQAH